jgi:uncharacterized protein (DUF2147 family)
MGTKKTFMGLVGSMGLMTLAYAGDPNSTGCWNTWDDHDHRHSGVVCIQNTSSGLEGKVTEISPRPGHPANPLCEACDGEKKGKPVLGMTILWGLVWNAESNQYEGGYILDPDSGTIYHCTLEKVGSELHVHGYIGFSLFGRTQVWTAVSHP